MSGWVKLHLIVEGDTEQDFARICLKPHLAQFQVSVNAFKLPTSRKTGDSGGALSWDRFRFNVERLLKQFPAKADQFSTMIDWYGLDPHFPNYAEACKLARPRDRADLVARKLQSHFDSPRLLPFFTLHEFEALLLCDLSAVAQRLPDHDKGITALAEEIGSIPPEDVNDGPNSHPSARFENHVSGYGRLKRRVGASAAAAIGLPALREKCPHFGHWLTRLEKLSETL